MSEQQLSEDIFGGAPASTGATGGSSVPPRRKRYGKSRALAALLVTVLALAGCAALALTVLRPMVSDLLGGPADYTASDVSTKKVTVTIPEGATGAKIGEVLAEAGVIKEAAAFTAAARDNAKAASIQPGNYSLAQHQPAATALVWLADPAHRIVSGVTIREGLRASEIYATLSKATGHPVADYTTAAKNAAALGLPASAKGNVEGYLFPSTYEFSAKNSAADQLKTMVSQTTSQLRSLGVADADMERTMIIASIVESEGKLDADKAKMARALMNRLEQGMPLQLNSTISYGLGKRTLDVSEADIANKDNPYNTYAHPGLPPGPIDNPGAASIKATIQPAQGTWLYWVTVNPNTGQTVFSTSYADHLKAVKQYQQWCSDHKGVCHS